MTIYIVLWILIILLCFLEVNCDVIKIGRYTIARTKQISFWILYIFILLMGIFRQELLGVDVINYRSYFFYYGNQNFINIIKNFADDNGYLLVNKIIYMFTNDFWMFKAILYFFTFTIFSYVIYKRSRYPAVSYLCYAAFGFIGLSFCILRQAIATNICFYSFRFIKEKKPVIFVLFVLVAISFHKTALFFLFLYPLANGFYENISRFKKIILLVFAVFVARFGLPVMYQFYRTDYSDKVIAGGGYNMLILDIIIILGLGFLIKKHAKNKEDENNLTIEYNALFVTIYAQVIATFFALFSRITLYFGIMFTIVVPNLIAKFKRKNWLLIIAICIFSLLYVIILNSNDTKIVPYLSIFDS